MHLRRPSTLLASTVSTYAVVAAARCNYIRGTRLSIFAASRSRILRLVPRREPSVAHARTEVARSRCDPWRAAIVSPSASVGLRTQTTMNRRLLACDVCEIGLLAGEELWIEEADPSRCTREKKKSK